MTTTDPNRLGPVTRAEYAALERRIEQLERRVGGAAEKTPREQFGWVIENESSAHSNPEYFTGHIVTRAMVWSDPGDHASALRFARKQDAEKIARQLSPFNNKHRVCEHCWVGPSDDHSAQLATRPVVAATDEQLMDVVGMMNAAARSMDAVVMLRSWLSTLDVRRCVEKNVWIASEPRAVKALEVYIDIDERLSLSTYGGAGLRHVLEPHTVTILEDHP